MPKQRKIGLKAECVETGRAGEIQKDNPQRRFTNSSTFRSVSMTYDVHDNAMYMKVVIEIDVYTKLPHIKHTTVSSQRHRCIFLAPFASWSVLDSLQPFVLCLFGAWKISAEMLTLRSLIFVMTLTGRSDLVESKGTGAMSKGAETWIFCGRGLLLKGEFY